MNSLNTKAIYSALKRVSNTQSNHNIFLASPPSEKSVALNLIISSLISDHFTPVILGTEFNPFDFSLSVDGSVPYYYSLATYTSMQSSPLCAISNHVSACKAHRLPGASCFVVYSMFVPIVKHNFSLAIAKRKFHLLKYMSENYAHTSLKSPINRTQLSSLGNVVPSNPKSIITNKLDSQWHFIIIELI